MNYSLAIFLVNPGTRCISVSYDKTFDVKGNPVGRELKSFKTLDANIKKHDFVVIPTDTRWGFTIGRVEEVDCRVNYNSTEEMRWVVARVDKEEYEDFCKQEQTLIQRAAEAEEEDQRRKLAEKFLAINPDLGNLSIVDQNAVARDKPAPEAPRRGGSQSHVRTPPPRSSYSNNEEDDTLF